MQQSGTHVENELTMSAIQEQTSDVIAEHHMHCLGIAAG